MLKQSVSNHLSEKKPPNFYSNHDQSVNTQKSNLPIVFHESIDNEFSKRILLNPKYKTTIKVRAS